MTTINLQRVERPVEICGKEYTIRSTPESRAAADALEREAEETNLAGASKEERTKHALRMIDIILGDGASKEIFDYCETPAEADALYILNALAAELKRKQGN